MKQHAKGHVVKQTAPPHVKQQQALDIVLPDPLIDWSEPHQGGPVIVLRSSRLGDTTIPEPLGKTLMASFIHTMAGNPVVPAALLLYGSAVCLASPDSPHLDALSRMQKDGCDILCCQISYTTLVDAEKPAVGRMADWVDLTDRMQKAPHVLWP